MTDFVFIKFLYFADEGSRDGFRSRSLASARLWNKVRIILIGFIVTTVLSCQKDTQTKNQVCFEGQCIEVELARTPEEQAKGLQFRTSLESNGGMLFIFSESRRYSFWMKDTLIPLDMVWISRSKKVVDITRNVSPCKTTPCPTYSPSSNVLYVLEVNAGYTEKLGIQVGDQAGFDI